MQALDLLYRHPEADRILEKNELQMAKPTASLYQDWLWFESNLNMVMPTKCRKECYMFFEQACLNQAFAIAESRCELMVQLLRGLPLPTGYFTRPGVIASFHMASYRILAKWLAIHRVPFVLLVANAVMEQQLERFHELIADCLYKPAYFKVLNADSAASLIHLREALKAGYYVLAYADGNSTAGDKKQEKHLLNYALGAAQIGLRTGLAYLAHWLKVPVYPVWTERTVDGVAFQCFPTMELDVGADRFLEAQRCTATLYNTFSTSLWKQPASWEAWFYLEDYLL